MALSFSEWLSAPLVLPRRIRAWLGDRYLLAERLARLSEARALIFTESRRWHPEVVAGTLVRISR